VLDADEDVNMPQTQADEDVLQLPSILAGN